MRMTKSLGTTYYMNRLWKISWVAVNVGRFGNRLLKFYERREAVGMPWKVIRSVRIEW